jgi:hypothetical protein
MTRPASSNGIDLDDAAVEVRAPWPSKPKDQALLDCGLLALTFAAVAVCLIDDHGLARLLIVAAATCLAPGGAILRRLSVDESTGFIGLAICFSFAVETAGALIMVWTGWWHPFGYAVALACAATALLLFDLGQLLRGEVRA